METPATIANAADHAAAKLPAGSTGRRIQATAPLHAAQPPMEGTPMPTAPTASMPFDAFLHAHGNDALTSLERLGDTYRLTVRNVVCEVDGATLADATLSEAMPGALLGSLLAAETAWDSGLPDSAIPGMLQAFRIGLTTYGTASAALAKVQATIRQATIVEGYVASAEGLVHDRARIAHFTTDALRGRLGNALLMAMPPESFKRRELIASYRTMLDQCLDDLIQAVREARESGDYAFATDLLSRFYQVCVDVTAAEEWQSRLADMRQSLTKAG